MDSYFPRSSFPTSSRGRGSRGSRGGFSNRGRGGSSAGHLSDSNAEFPLHPRTRFGQDVGITRADLSVKEIGFYSLYGDMTDETAVELRNDKSYLRPLTMRCAASGDTPVPIGSWNLDDGFNKKTTDERFRFRRGIPVLMKWTKDYAEDPSVHGLRYEYCSFYRHESADLEIFHLDERMRRR